MTTSRCVPAGRLSRDLEDAARFSATSEGVTRLAWSPELAAAHEWLAGQMARAALRVEVDTAGNLLGKWSPVSEKALLIGSHFNTVAHGRAFDGALGVLGGLEALRILRETGFEPKRPIWLASFMDEESPRFGTTFFGSRAFVGDDLSALRERRDAEGVTLGEAMAARGYDFDRLAQARAIDQVDAYIELHIEQGPVFRHVPAAMLFVPSRGGLSHAPGEFTGERHCEFGARVLARVIAELAS